MKITKASIEYHREEFLKVLKNKNSRKKRSRDKGDPKQLKQDES